MSEIYPTVLHRLPVSRACFAFTVASCLTLTISHSARAQEEARSQRAPGALTEIVVTARKRDEGLQSAPIAITALDEQRLIRMGADNFEQYARSVPSVSFASAGPSRSKIFMRGISDGQSAVNTEASVAVYFDEQPVTMGGQQPDLRLFDIDRVEVLRGPQGTLFGASSMGGTIRIITNKPDPSAFAGTADATLSTTRGGDESYELNGMLNMPLIDDVLALRIVGFYRDEGGFIDNVFSPGPRGPEIDNAPFVGSDVNSQETRGGRIAARWIPSDTVTATTSFLYQHAELDGLYDFTPDTGDLQQVRFADERVRDEFWQANLTINADLGFGELVSATSYFDRKLRYEADNTDYLANNPYYDWGPGPSFFSFDQRQETFTQELRLTSPAGGRLEWLVGGFFMDRKDTSADTFVTPGIQDSPSAEFFAAYYDIEIPDEFFITDNRANQKQYALFGEFNFHVTPQVEASLGLRWYRVERDFNSLLEFITFGEVREGVSTETGFNPKFLLSYSPTEQALLYATASRGFRVGGPNTIVQQVEGIPGSYDSDTLWNYEVGAKTEWLDGRLVFNAAAYYIDWSDIQVDDRPPGSPVNIVVNAGEARIRGTELEAIFQPIPQLELAATFAWNDAELSEDSPQLNAPSGARLASVPRTTFYTSATYTFPLPQWQAQGYLRGDYSYVGDSVNRVDPTQQLVQPSYNITNLRLGMERGPWQAALFVDNVFDERAVLLINNFFRDNRVTPNRPRTTGIHLRYNF